ncbi:TonB-dependent receptor [Mariniflexile litorale]|uniref:TonB-dependent receptor n=1 Tax=Mariniflexile litorale TaxID=3045158 RepID=A0AAU7EKW3_9FLAO|nr:TonB-dependent receptor [Mariniflexile sp. KMM 9835]MDQ8211138.1 TonB-dependent receptor [Mariniflexile sp. KMM 9835]
MKKIIKRNLAGPYFPKINLKMKLTTILLIVSLFKVQANTYSQNTKLTLTVKDVTVGYVFNQIESMSEFRFLFESDKIDLNRKVTIDVQKKKIGDILEILFGQTNIEYKTSDRQILLTLKKVTSSTIKAYTINPVYDIIQSYAINGTITDANGQPLAGANIIEKGTMNGAQSDFDGTFSLKVSNPNATIVVSYVGFFTKEVAINNQKDVNVALLESENKLDEVIVIGYGTVKKRDLTGAVSSVKSEEIGMAPVVSPIEAIQGRVAGLEITRNDGRTGSGFNILLRGTRSLTANSDPIYIIDGIQGSPDNLNPNDIASIDVLKDASSTAIYGSAGANGVIIITTKKAEEGKIQVDFNSYISINDNPSYPSPLKGDAWLDYLREGYIASFGVTPANGVDLLSAYNLTLPEINEYIENGKYVDWVDETFQRGIQTNNTLSIRGGNEKVQASFSLGHNKTEGIYKGDKLNVYTMRSDLNINATPWAKFGITTGLVLKDQEYNRSRISKSFGIMPLGDAYDENGDINKYPMGEVVGLVSVLANDIPGTYKKNNKSYNITANPYAEFSLATGLSLKSILGVSVSNSRAGEFKSDHTYLMLTGSENAVRSGSYETKLAYNYTLENILNYKTTINENHDLGATFITSYAESQNEGEYGYSEGFLYDDFSFYNIGAGLNQNVSSSYSAKKRMSYAGRLNYSFKGKYLLTGSVRYDGASQLADNTWDVFPAGAIAWRISDEGFMDGSKNWLSNLKLRAGYGVSGNTNIDAYVTKSETTNGDDSLNFGSGEVLTTIPTEFIGYKQLSWEKSYNLNIGLDFGLLRNRIDASVEWYNTDTKDVIYERKLPTTIGSFSPKVSYAQYGNIAEMNNNGIELTLNSTNIRTKNFQWSSTLTFARNWEEIKSINLSDDVSLNDLKSEGLFIGSPRDVYYDYKKIGIWQLGEEADAAVFGLLPGDVKIESSLTKISDGVWGRTIIDGSGNAVEEQYTASNAYTINATDDQQIIGQERPTWTAGFQNTFKYKSFDLNIFATARYGQTINGELLGYFKQGVINIPDNYDYWTPTNPTNDYPRPYASSRSTVSSPTVGLSYVDASYIKINNITLGYSLPERFATSIGATSFRLYGTLYNALVITKSHLLDGLDPETSASDTFPLYKQMVFGLNMSF